MKKIIILLIVLSGFTLFIPVTKASRAFIGYDGRVYHPTHVFNTLRGMGYDVAYYNNPSQHVIRDRLNWDVVFLLGHGSFDTLTTGPSSGVSMNYDYQSSSVYFVGLNSNNIRNVNLMIFAGCETSKTGAYNNLARKSTELGARSSIGWTTVTTTYYLEIYVNHMMNALRSGKGVQDAINYANSFYYPISDVKNAYAWGDTSTKINWITPLSSISIEGEPIIYDIKDEISLNLEDTYESKLDSKKTRSEIIYEYIKKNINVNFIEKDYIWEINDNQDVITLTYSPNKIKTPNIYTITLKDSKISKISSYVEKDFEKKYMFLNDINILSSEELLKTDINKDGEKITESGYYYDKEKECVYFYKVVLKNVDGNNIKDIELFEIK